MSMAAAELGFPTPLSPPHPPISREVELRRAAAAAARSAAEAAAAGVVFEDESLLVVDKPAGVYCEALLSSLRSSPQAQGSKTARSNLHLANRLDRDTSGLMVITKCKTAAAKLVHAFTEHKVKKTYLAVCTGQTPCWQRIKISSGHGRSKHGAWRVYAMRDVGRTLPGGSTVRQMTTAFEILGINGKGKFKQVDLDAANDIELIMAGEEPTTEILYPGKETEIANEMLIRAYPQSGRTHQIRLHCQYLGLPIKGDVKYCGVHEWKGELCQVHELHAESLSFAHPITGLQLSLQASLPAWASDYVSAMQQDL